MAVWLDEHDRRNAVIGVITFALALFVILIGFGSVRGCSPQEYTVELDARKM